MIISRTFDSTGNNIIGLNCSNRTGSLAYGIGVIRENFHNDGKTLPL